MVSSPCGLINSCGERSLETEVRERFHQPKLPLVGVPNISHGPSQPGAKPVLGVQTLKVSPLPLLGTWWDPIQLLSVNHPLQNSWVETSQASLIYCLLKSPSSSISPASTASISHLLLPTYVL